MCAKRMGANDPLPKSVVLFPQDALPAVGPISYSDGDGVLLVAAMARVATESGSE